MHTSKKLKRLFLTALDYPGSISKIDLYSESILGHWCFKNAQEAESMLHVPIYQGESIEEESKNNDIVNESFEKLMPLLSESLNVIHGTSYSNRFWLVLAGYWFRQYLDILQHRYTVLKKVYSTNDQFTISEIKKDNFWIAQQTDDFSTGIFDHKLNHQIFSEIAKLLPGFYVTDSLEFSSSYSGRVIGRGGILKSYINWILLFFAKLSKYSKVIITSTYFSYGLLLRLAFKFKVIPVLSVPKPRLRNRNHNMNLRNYFYQISSKDLNDFEIIAIKLIGKFIPMIFMENFNEFIRYASKTRPHNARVFLTANAFAAKELYKAWVALSKEIDPTIKHLIVQHGGNYGHSKIHSEENFELKSSDYFITSGWSSKQISLSPKKLISVSASPRLGGIGFYGDNIPENNKDGRIIFILASLPKYKYTQWSAPQGRWFLDYLNDQKFFMNSLSPKVRPKLLLRPYTYDYGWQDLNFLNPKLYGIEVDNSRKSLRPILEKSKCAVFTYDSTSMMETMALNIPTLCFWDPQAWEWRENAKPLLKELASVGIFHESGISAAKHLNQLIDSCSLEEWWSSEEVQRARNNYCLEYANTTSDPFSDWAKFMENLIESN